MPRPIINIPSQIADGVRSVDVALQETRMPKLSRRTGHIILCGMGGSALPGLLLEELIRNDARLQKLHIHTVVHRNYGLPKEASFRPALVVVTSYSGNTEEALSSYTEARKRRLPLLVIASGGKLVEWSKRDRIPCARIPDNIPQPRFAIPVQLSALISLLVATKLLPKTLRNELIRTGRSYNFLTQKTNVQSLAKNLSGRIPIFYASDKNATLAYILKINMNESVKIPAFTNVFPELNHNEFNMYAALSQKQTSLRKNIAVVFLNDLKDHVRIRQRMALTAQFIKKSGVPVYSIRLAGQRPIQKALNAITLAQQFSMTLAQNMNVDPIPVDLVEEFKKKLK